MPTKANATQKGLRGSEAQARIRLLLALWDIGGADKEVKKKELTDRAKLNNERVGDYKDVFEQLEKKGAITITTKKQVMHVSLTKKGLQMLDTGIKSPDFEFDGNQVRAKDVHALLQWIRERDTLSNRALPLTETAKTREPAITSYEHFKSEVLPMFEKLDKTKAYSGLVPIWHLRRELRERVSPEDFNNWMMEMQAEQLFYLQSGEARGATDDQKRDSIKSEIRGLLFFASKPS